MWNFCFPDYLLLAAVKGNQDQKTVEYLLAECHSDPNVTDEERKTPLDLANDPEIIKLLLKQRSQGCQCLQETHQAHWKALLRATPQPSSVCAHHWRRWRGEEHSVEVHSELKRVLVSIPEGKTCRWRRCEDSRDHTV